ncbi:MAG TPA: hypothetical protein V6C65_16365 [Allocoleopsis sp.]
MLSPASQAILNRLVDRHIEKIRQQHEQQGDRPEEKKSQQGKNPEKPKE